MATLRYGVFNLGQIWTVVADDGSKIGFPTRELAIGAATDLADIHVAHGSSVVVMVQDELGNLRHFSPH